jgi:hypothetical protein
MNDEPSSQPTDSTLQKLLSPKIDGQFFDRMFQSLDSTFDPSYWVLTELGIDLFDNQIEILDNVVDLNKH